MWSNSNERVGLSDFLLALATSYACLKNPFSLRILTHVSPFQPIVVEYAATVQIHIPLQVITYAGSVISAIHKRPPIFGSNELID
jgi:hypothetical protein